MSERSARIVLPEGANPDATLEAVRTFVEVDDRRAEFTVVLGDLTEVAVDTIVCPSNPLFQYTEMGGVQAVIARKAGMATFKDAERQARNFIKAGGRKRTAGVPRGHAVTTTPGNLKQYKSIIHVNNVREEKGRFSCDEETVQRCTTNALLVADDLELTTLATPALGTGLYNVSMPDSIRGTMKGMEDYLSRKQSPTVGKLVVAIYSHATLEHAQLVHDLLQTEVFPGLGNQQ